MSYQPVWIDGRQVRPGRRDSDSRYRAIADHLAGRTGFTVLDFGAYIGYFSRRLVEDFGARCLAVDNCSTLEHSPGVEILKRRLTPGEVRGLGTFDVALCLSVLHHVEQWREMLDALLAAAPTVFIETANPDEVLPKASQHQHSAAIHAAVEATGARVLTYTPGYDANYQRPLWVVEC